MGYSRRELLAFLGGTLATLFVGIRRGEAGALSGNGAAGNFAYIYGNPTYRAEFRDFLVNVFHLYPEDEMHALITRLSTPESTDEAVYRTGQRELATLKPFLGDLTYSLPALRKQKRVIADQTADLLARTGRYEGYLELGSTGRYLDRLEGVLDVAGPVYLIAARPPSYSLADMLDRGQLTTAGTYIALDNYNPDIFKAIPSASLDLVTVYIGFHHSPLNLREAFINGVRDCLRPGGSLIVRDHDVTDEKMRRLVGLAHDVFNMGTSETWNYNRDEFRGFYSLQALDQLLTSAGFAEGRRQLFQSGDPTRNALLHYRRA